MKKFLVLFSVVLVIALPRIFNLGRDITNPDSTHFKNWSYVFMQEFEAGNYTKLHYTIQPGIPTIYSNIIGYKALYFVKDKLCLVKAEGKELELLMHTSQKVPKAGLIVFLSVCIFYLVKELWGNKVTAIFLVLFATEPYFVGQSRVIQTDALPAYLIFLATLLLIKLLRDKNIRAGWSFGTIGFLLGLAVIERTSSLLCLPAFCLPILYAGTSKTRCKRILMLVGTVFITMVVLFPAFWGDFLGTFYRLTVGSYVQGVRGLDAETSTFAPAPHQQLWFYYFRFLYNQMSEFVWLGLVALVVSLRCKTKKSVLLNPLVLIPLFYFVGHQLAAKKIDRYTTTLFPFFILGASFGLSYVFKHAKSVVFGSFVGFVLLVRLIQFNALFPDFLLYQNPLSLDFDYNTTSAAFGSGGYKLGQLLQCDFGNSRTILLADYTRLYLFYPGKVKNMDDFSCGDLVDLVVGTHPLDADKECILNQVELRTTYTISGGFEFFVYEKI